MRNELFRKGLVCAILVLFIGIAIIPSIHAEVSKTNFVQKKTNNIPPVADAGGPYKGKAGEVIVLNGSDSYDPDGIIVEWYWYYFIKFGPLATLPTTIGFGETIEYSWDLHSCPFFPIYVYLCLRVTDDDGAIDYDETNVIIRNPVSNQQLSIGSQSSKSVLPSSGTKVVEKSFMSTFNGNTLLEEYYTLNITVIGGGDVIKDPDWELYPEGTIVNLTAVPYPGWWFDWWQGDVADPSCPITTITMDGNKEVTAWFFAIPIALCIDVVGCGTTTPAPGIHSYSWGTVVDLEAFADPGWEFEEWTGDLTGSENPTIIFMDGYKEVTATFTDITPPEITNVMATPPTQVTGGYVNITATVTDNVAVDTVLVDITSPMFATEEMTNIPGTDTYYYNTTYTEIGTYEYSIWANDTSGNEATSDTYQFEIIDKTPPVTTIEFGEPYYKDLEGNIYVTSDTPIYLNATDDGSGVNATYYKINEGNWVKYAAPFSIPEDCNHAIYFYSDDNAGNEESIKNKNVSVDNYPPYPVIPPPDGENGWYNSSVIITFTDEKSGISYIMYRIDNGPWEIYCDPILITGDGLHTVDYYAVDNVGNEGTGSFSFKIDQTPPTIELTVEKIDFLKWLVTAEVSDETSGINRVEFYLDGILQYVDEEAPYEVFAFIPGYHVVKAVAYDNAGNSAQDGKPVSHSHSQSQSSNQQYPQSSSNDQNFVNVLPSRISEENHVLVNDLVGYFNSIRESEECGVNVTVNGTMGNNGWYISDVTITITWDPEEIAEVYYKIDDGEWTLYAEPIVISEDGLHTFCWYCVDNEGNQSNVCGPFYFKIDQTPPTIELTVDVEKIGVMKRLLIAADVSDETSGVNRVELSVYVNWTMGHKHIFLTCYEEPYEWTLLLSPALGWLVKIEAKATVYDNAGNSAEDEKSVSHSHSQSQTSNQCPQSSSNDQLPYAPLFCESALGSYIDTVELGKKDDLSPGRPILVVEFLSGNRVKITNIGTATAYNVHLKLELQGGFVPIGRVREIVIDEIEPDESVIRYLGRVFGFGMLY